MDGTPTGFWGKLRQHEDGTVVAWHPLADHCADVAATCEALLERTLLRRRLARLGGLEDLGPVQVSRLAAIAALHDVGKFNVGFQNKALRPRPSLVAGHVEEACRLFDDAAAADRDRFLGCLPLADLCAWGEDEAALRLLVAAIGHHGRPLAVSGGHQCTPWQAARGLDPFAGIADLATRLRTWFPEAFFGDDAHLLPSKPSFQHGFAGLVMLADWLGSDTRIFPFAEPGEGDRMVLARKRARLVLEPMGLDPAASRASLGAAAPGFERVSPHPPREMQTRVANLPAEASGGLVILEAETGAGKTEAALARFLTLFHAGLVDGMVFALPTRTASTQIHRRVVEAVARAFPEPGSRPPVVLAVPGYLRVDDEDGRRLPGFEVLWSDDPGQRWRHRGWAAESPKRYLAGAIVVGTIDQVLLSTLTVGHAHLRATALLRQLLVVDEVHASDAYMTELLRSVLSYHVTAGGHALLMSATLGSAAAAGLAAAAGAVLGPSTVDAASRAPYPLVTCISRGGVERLPARPPASDKRVEVVLRPAMEDAEAVAEDALAAARAGAKVIILRNTVAGCLATQQAAERFASESGSSHLLFRCAGVPAPHHSRFAKEDREALDLALEAQLGKERPEGGIVVVATQTIQQSLDLDADLLITDLAPMDVWLQRVGRLHRHRRDSRPEGFERPRVIVLCPADRDVERLIDARGVARGPHGLGTIYEDLRVIEATWRTLEGAAEISIPAMNRALVEAATHPDALAAVGGAIGGGFARHHEVMTGKRLAEVRLADMNLVDREARFGHLDEDGARFPPRELQGRVQTRLGEGDRLAELPVPLVGPFGGTIRRFTIPAWMARGAGPDAAAGDVQVEPGRIGFQFGARRYMYDRLGLRAIDVAPKEEESDG